MKKLIPILLPLIFLSLLILLSEKQSTLNWSDFFNYLDFWKNTLILGMLYGTLLAMSGFWMISENAIYSGLAISSSSVLGLMITSFILEIFQIQNGTGGLLYLGSIIFGIGLYLFFTKVLQKKYSKDAIIATIYLASTGGTVLLSNWISQGHHEFENLIFGNSVTVLQEDFWICLIAGIILIGIGILFRRQWLALIFDKLYLQVRGHPVVKLELLLNLFISLSLIFAVKLFGIITVFTLILFAPLSAWHLKKSGMNCYALSAYYGLLIFPAGFLFSFFLDLPTGACICLAGFLLFLFSLILQKTT